MVSLLIALFLLPYIGAAVGSPGVTALFFSRFGVEFLPVMYIALGAITMIASVVLTAMMGRVSRKRLYLFLPAFLTLTLVVSRLLVGQDLNWFYPLLWLWAFLLWTLQGLFTWGLSGMVCNTRQAKRLFPLFGAGGILGIAIGGLLTRPLVGLLGAENLLLIWAGTLLLTSGLVGSLLKDVDEERRSPWRGKPGLLEELQKGYYTVRRSPLLRWIAIAAILFSILFFSIAFPFSEAVAAQYPDEDALAGFWGVFQGMITTAAFLISLLLANRFYARFGFISAILFYSIIYLTGFGALLVSVTFVALAAFRFLQMVWMQGFSDSAYQAIYNVVSEDYREQTRAFVNGFPQQLGVVAAGIMLAVGQRVLQPQHMFMIAMVTAAVTAYAMWRAGREYQSALVDALRAGRPQLFFTEEEPFGGFRHDAAAIDIAVAGISDPNPSVRQVSATILGNLEAPGAALVAALDDPVAEVRAALLKALARAKETSALLEVTACLRDPEPAVRLQAADTLAQLTSFPKGVRAHLFPLLSDPEPRVRARVAVILLGYGEHAEASEALRQMSVDEDPSVRGIALEAFAEWGDPSGFEVAEAALRDALPGVRRRAVIALASIDANRCHETLLQKLADEDRSVREATAAILGEIGAPILSRVVAALQDPALEDGALTAMTKLPARQAADDVLAYTRQKVSEAVRYDKLLLGLAGIGAKNDHLGLLSVSLANAARQHAGRAIQAIGLLNEPESMAITLSGLESRNLAQRANALEMLDSLAERQLIGPVIHLWDPETISTRDAETSQLSDIILAVLQDSDEWLCACAVMAAIGVDTPEIREAIARLSASDSALVSETAGYVLAGVDMDTLSTIPIMQRILYLRKVSLFAELSPVDLKQLAAIAGEHLFHDGEHIAREGEPGDEMFVIVSGEVVVRVSSEDGEEVLLAVRQPGEAVGEMSIISHEPRTASLVAKGDVRALCLEKKPFETMLRERPDVSLAVMRVLINRLQELSH